jgi:hypothetical protein
MGIVLKKGPQRGQSAVGKALSDLRGRAGPEALLGGAALNLSEPLPVYRLGLNQIETPECVTKAEHVGWRYLVEGAGGAAGFADVKDSGGESPTFASFSQNANAARLMEAANLAQQVAQSLPDEYEARILEVPALQTSAIWLAHDRHIFIPYVDMKRLRGEKVRVEPDFLDDLVNRARQLAATRPDESSPSSKANQ